MIKKIAAAAVLFTALSFGQSMDAQAHQIENTELKQGESKKAQFPGGTQAYDNWLVQNFYQPQDVKRYGTVIVEFVVKKNGKCSDFTVVKAIDEQLDLAAVEILKYMPKWEPALKNGEAVDSKVRMPVRFINQSAQ